MTCAAVRAGFSRFSAAASSSICGAVRGVTCRGGGASASNPPARQVRIHRSSRGPRHPDRLAERAPMRLPASSRTTRPRCRVDSAGSAASRISS